MCCNFRYLVVCQMEEVNNQNLTLFIDIQNNNMGLSDYI